MGASKAWGGLLRWMGQMRPAPLLGVAGLLAAAAVAGVALHSLATSDPVPSGRDSPAALRLADANGVLDSDNDGVSDARENYIYGTNPFLASTGGSGIPDGWLVRHGLDPLDPGVADRPAAVPPPEALPRAYRGAWPAAFTPSVREIYSYGRPAGWNETAQGPHDSGLDPRRWDSSGDGIPDAFLLRFGLDPFAKDMAGQRLAGPGGLTIREAFDHATDPRKLDTDGDGIHDAEEVAGPANPRDGTRFAPTDPTRFDTSGAGVCDGYLRAHGLDPSDPTKAYGDPDRDGAATREEFQHSRQRFGEAACASGRGLNPSAMFSGGLPIPDGWLLRHGLDALDPATPARVTQRASADPGPAVQPLLGLELPADLPLTVLDEYLHGRPSGWSEPADGPWWGGTNPLLGDTDGDGLGDAWEKRGFLVAVATDPLQSTLKPAIARSDPARADSDGDGLTDGQEARGFDIPQQDGTFRKGVATDPQRTDTDFDGLTDKDEVGNGYDLDPSLADSTVTLNLTAQQLQNGDHLRDGERLAVLLARAQSY
ncbi:MAG TPA: hypothetical protein VHI93_05005, partial [Candidatus Thermoplasmatota archaeon]|nr:hypothetical protein [Candidatus Thermoplasmatota archaeon]